MQKLNKIILTLSMVGVNGLALAQGSTDWTPPKSPALHEASDLDYQNPYSGPFIGFGLGFGQANVSDGKAGLFYNGQVELGYMAMTQQLSKFEVAFEALYGGSSFKLEGEKASLDGMLGGIARVGYGYSLAKGMFATMRVGLGAAFSDYSIDGADETFKSKESASGILMQAGWAVSKRVTDSIEIEGAFEFTHAQLELGKVENNNVEQDLDRTLIMNIPSLSLGVRFVL